MAACERERAHSADSAPSRRRPIARTPDDARLLPGLFACTAPRASTRRACGRGQSARRRPGRDRRLDLLRSELGARRRPPARRGPAGPQPGARRSPGGRRGPRPLRGLLQPPLGRRPRGRRGAPAWPPRCPRCSGRPFANSVRVLNIVELLQGLAPVIEERVAARLEPNPLEHLQHRRLLGLPAGAPRSDHRLRRPRAADRHGRRHQRLRRQPRELEHGRGVLRRRLLGVAHELGAAPLAGRSSTTPARCGADAILAACPLCHANLDFRQSAMSLRGEPPMPVLYITQLVGLALGLPMATPRLRAPFRRHPAAVRASRPRGRQGGRRGGRARSGEGREGRRQSGRVVSRIGVFVCHCGENIARTVDCARGRRGPPRAPRRGRTPSDYKYMCSDPGQQLIKKAIEEERPHRRRGRGLLAAHARDDLPPRRPRQAGLNPFLVRDGQHPRALLVDPRRPRARRPPRPSTLARTIVEKVKHNQPLQTIRIPVTKRALVIGGGIAGIQAALDIADGGHEVVLVEKEPSIGGHMSQLSETFPTLDCSQCILTPRMVEAYQHPRIKLYTYSEVEKVDGYIGNFEVKIRKKARSVDEDLCNGCGDCQTACPSRQDPERVRRRAEQAHGDLRARSPRPCPTSRCIDREHCTLFKAAARASEGRLRQVQGGLPEGRHRLRRRGHLRHARRSARSSWPPAFSSTPSAASSPRAQGLRRVRLRRGART